MEEIDSNKLRVHGGITKSEPVSKILELVTGSTRLCVYNQLF